MTNVTQITDHSIRALSRLSSQFKGKENLEKLVKIFTDELQELEDAQFDLLLLRSVSTSVGVQLDNIGEHVGSLRGGQNDTEYRASISLQIGVNNSEATEMIIHDITKQLTNATSVSVLDDFPAGLNITTNGTGFTGSVFAAIEGMIGAGISLNSISIVPDPSIAFAFSSADGGGVPAPEGLGFSSTDEGGSPTGGEFTSIQEP